MCRACVSTVDCEESFVCHRPTSGRAFRRQAGAQRHQAPVVSCGFTEARSKCTLLFPKADNMFVRGSFNRWVVSAGLALHPETGVITGTPVSSLRPELVHCCPTPWPLRCWLLRTQHIASKSVPQFGFADLQGSKAVLPLPFPTPCHSIPSPSFLSLSLFAASLFCPSTPTSVQASIRLWFQSPGR